jgi:hypothetical protein
MKNEGGQVMSSIAEMVQSQLGSNGMAQLSQHLGTDPNTTQTAVAAALPMLLGAMAHRASQPDGAAVLHSEAEKHATGSGALASAAAMAGGSGLLGRLLGGKQDDVRQEVSKTSGLDVHQAEKALLFLAPIVLAQLGRKKQEAGLAPDQLGTVLHQEGQVAEEQAKQQAPHLGGALGAAIGRIFGVGQ